MIKITKLEDSIDSSIIISDGEKSFIIGRKHMPDPCWYPDINEKEEIEDIKFIIEIINLTVVHISTLPNQFL